MMKREIWMAVGDASDQVVIAEVFLEWDDAIPLQERITRYGNPAMKALLMRLNAVLHASSERQQANQPKAEK